MKEIKQNKKLILIIIFIVLIGNISTVFAYSLIASNVGFESKDTSWQVTNTKDALDDLRKNVGGSITGQIISYMGTKAPYGYLVCDGSTYNIEDYPKLAEQIKYNFGEYNHFGGDGTTTFAVPDLRGEFLRGTGTNSHSGQGSGATVGVHQDATEFPSYTAEGKTFGMDNGYITNYDARKNGTTTWACVSGSTNNGGGVGTYYTGRYLPRSTNTSVLYLIKY